MKALQEKAQSENTAPVLDYSHYQTKDLAINIGKMLVPWHSRRLP
ncbi:hypothetical protein [Ruminococcus sp. AM42-11]|nr:hypothetical protein [Ruminococcus sp. AM42-11]